MEIESVDRARRIVNITSSHEEGGFIGDSSSGDSPVQRAVSSVVELYITQPRNSKKDFDALETGDKEVLAKYLVPDEDMPGRYAFAQGCYAWMQVAHSSIRCVDGLIEYAPFAEATERIEAVS